MTHFEFTKVRIKQQLDILERYNKRLMSVDIDNEDKKKLLLAQMESASTQLNYFYSILYDYKLPILETERFAWSIKTFPEATAISSLRKLETEIKEIENDINRGIQNPEEYADALMCLFDSAGRHGITFDEIEKAFANKLIVNKNRQWVKNPDNSYSHVK